MDKNAARRLLGKGRLRNALDALYLKSAESFLPSMMFKKRIMVRTRVVWRFRSGDDLAEFPARRDAINITGMNTEADETAGELIRSAGGKTLGSPKNRSAVEPLGTCRRERDTTGSCCLRMMSSAMAAFVPPGPGTLATVVSRWAGKCNYPSSWSS